MFCFVLFLCSINSFYRFVLEPELTLVSNNVIEPVAMFLDIPESPLLTLNMITPGGWLVETVHSNCDLDNIHLKDVSYHVNLYKERKKINSYQLLTVASE